MKVAFKKMFFGMTLALSLLAWASVAAGSNGAGFSFGGTEGKNGNCMDCHGSAAKVGSKRYIDPVKYAHTDHARIGCQACHDKIVVQHSLGGLVSEKADCRSCHTEIGAEYAASNHAGKAECNGCHNPHRVRAGMEVSGKEINAMCAGCHDNHKVTASHAKWLPQADLHIDMLPCITCHTASANYVINMYIINRQDGARFGKFDLAGYDKLHKLSGEKDILSLIDVNDDRYISLDELRNFNRNPKYEGLHLSGMMTPERITHGFQILANRRDCTFCHASGPGTMQTSFLSFPDKNGSFQRVAVEKGAVLDALYGTPDFYMMGKTRNSTLDKIGLLVIAGGMVMPVGHGLLRFLSRNIRNRKEKDHE